MAKILEITVGVKLELTAAEYMILKAQASPAAALTGLRLQGIEFTEEGLRIVALHELNSTATNPEEAIEGFTHLRNALAALEKVGSSIIIHAAQKLEEEMKRQKQ